MKTSNKVEEIKKDFEANLLDGDAVQAGQMLASTFIWEWVEQTVPALIEAEKALVLEEVLEQKDEYRDYDRDDDQWDILVYAVPTKVIQQKLDQVTQIIKSVKS